MENSIERNSSNIKINTTLLHYLIINHGKLKSKLKLINKIIKIKVAYYNCKLIKQHIKCYIESQIKLIAAINHV